MNIAKLPEPSVSMTTENVEVDDVNLLFFSFFIVKKLMFVYAMRNSQSKILTVRFDFKKKVA